jgi:hypothetical protein
MSLEKAIDNAFRKATKKGWDCIYLHVDVHETIVEPNYSKEEIPTDFYPLAKEVLQYLSGRKDIVLILWTCSWPEEVEKYLAFFAENGIEFRHANKNPEVESVGYGYYEDKPYADLLFDDKAGFDHETDWAIVFEAIKNKDMLVG